MINVLIVDDHTIVRHGLAQIVTAEGDMTVLGEAQNGDEALELVARSTPDVVVLDITMPGRNGLETLKEIKRRQPDVSVIMLSMHPKDQYAVRVLKAGASGYITKESAPEELVVAIRKAYSGGKYISPDVAELLASYIGHDSSEEPHRRLSDREFEVFRQIATGKSISQISADLNLSVKTVSTYRTRILEKTGFTSNADIVKYCIENALT
ncbi:MAG TPA: response regulator transcription factor [Pyrinomonadaceae bacterium]|nr:response regulator transcription factor [Pyrinomonadaceae bacterium]